MVPALISSAQTPQQASNPQNDLPLPRAFLQMFFQAHLLFLRRKPPTIQLSSHYRALILACKQSIEAQTPDSPHILSLAHAHKVFHLIETLYLSEDSDTHISRDLIEWHVLNNHPDNSSRTTDFWDELMQHLLVADFQSARNILAYKMHEEGGFDTDWASATAAAHLGHSPPPKAPAYATLDALLDRAPELTIAARNDGSWDNWQGTCLQWANSEELEKTPQIRQALTLLSGKPRALAAVCRDWQSMFVASVIYLVDESAGGNIRGGFGLLSAACAEASARFPVPDDAGGALVEAAMGNVKEAIVRLEACMSSTFFAAHMCDLLILMGKMADIPATEIGCEDSDIGMSEFYLREYARELELYPGCWRLAADYYMSCDTQATSLLVSFLKRVQYQGVGDPVAEKVLLLCEEKRLEKTARKIREKLGNECAELNNLGGAMAWYAGAGLQKRAQGIADEALRGAEREGVDSEGARRLSYVVSAVNNYAEETMRQVFDYMKVYHDMQEALSSMFALKEEDSPEQFDRFATDFIDSARSLVGSGGLPRRYWCVVVYDAANVLQLIPVVANHFSRTAILDLLGAMQLASGPHSSGELLEGLRARIAYDARAGENAMTDQDALSTVEVAQGVLTHCRTVFVRASATRINAA